MALRGLVPAEPGPLGPDEPSVIGIYDLRTFTKFEVPAYAVLQAVVVGGNCKMTS